MGDKKDQEDKIITARGIVVCLENNIDELVKLVGSDAARKIIEGVLGWKQ